MYFCFNDECSEVEALLRKLLFEGCKICNSWSSRSRITGWREVVPTELSKLNFGQYDGFDEESSTPQFFDQSFVLPFSIALGQLNNRSNFIIVGKKGSGKSSAQLHLKRQLEATGYSTIFFRFFNDVTAEDYRKLATTQPLSFTAIVGKDAINQLKNIFNNYDFRSVWEREIFVQISQLMKGNGLVSRFTKFVDSTLPNAVRGFLVGLLKSLQVKISIPVSGIAAELSLDLNGVIDGDGRISIENFNRIAKELFIEAVRTQKIYMFIDELVLSKLDAQDDEVRIRAALIRDIFKVVNDLNILCSRNTLDVHFICTLRPEIRNLLNDFDSEISKIIDSRDVLLHWDSKDNGRSVLLEIFEKKVRCGGFPDFDFSRNVEHEISFGNKSTSIENFLLTNSWYRPRDIIRYLKCYQKANPSHTSFSADGFKSALNEYSRVSGKEILDELSVEYNIETIKLIKSKIQRKRYTDLQSFSDAISGIANVNVNQLTRSLFESGVIGNVDSNGGGRRFFWSHRGEEEIQQNMPIMVHKGLWNYFNIRHQ
jgi:hypothetical protein